MFQERLIRARKSAGLSMKALAEEVGLSANAIKKYEHGDAMPTSGNLLKLSKALGVRSEYFFRPTNVKLNGVEYRKRSTAPKKILDKINGDILDQAERWTELFDLYPDSDMPVQSFALPKGIAKSRSISIEGVEKLAEQMRQCWDLGSNPIPDLVDTMESNGIMIIKTQVSSGQKFDGLACSIDNKPVVVISNQIPGDRQRFTLAHELGHLVLSDYLAPDVDVEKACDRFAGAFLLPNKALKSHLGNKRSRIEWPELVMLKHEFGVSMLAILFRAHQCGVINENQFKRSCFVFNKKGWRKQEPGDPYPQQNTTLFKQLVYRALGQTYIGESKAAELLGVSTSSFHEERKLGVADAAVNQ